MITFLNDSLPYWNNSVISSLSTIKTIVDNNININISSPTLRSNIYSLNFLQKYNSDFNLSNINNSLIDNITNLGNNFVISKYNPDLNFNFSKTLYYTLNVYKENVFTWLDDERFSIITDNFKNNSVNFLEIEVLDSLITNKAISLYSNDVWSNATNIIKNNSSKWNNITQYYTLSNSIDSAFNTYKNNINKWGFAPAVDWGDVYSLSGEWTSTYSTVSTNSASWFPFFASLLNLATLSGNWNTTTTTVSSLSNTWERARQVFLGNIHTLSGGWNSMYTTLCSKSAYWNQLPYVNLGPYNTLSSVYESTYKWVDSYEDTWNAYVILADETEKFEDLGTTIFQNSAFWNASKVGFKNMAINGNFDIWQRGTTITSNFVDGGGRIADRWNGGVNLAEYSSYSPIGTVTMSRQTCTEEELNFFNATYYYRQKYNNVSMSIWSLSSVMLYGENNFIIGTRHRDALLETTATT
jgi:hypothetical protein